LYLSPKVRFPNPEIVSDVFVAAASRLAHFIGTISSASKLLSSG
jgi:hypothetical protein